MIINEFILKMILKKYNQIDKKIKYRKRFINYNRIIKKYINYFS